MYINFWRQPAFNTFGRQKDVYPAPIVCEAVNGHDAHKQNK